MTYEEMYLCRAQIICIKAGLANAPLDEYSYPTDSGEFTGTLAFRCWHPNNKMLLCYFDTDDGRQFKLPVWWQSWGVNYIPAETHINFVDEVEDGTQWRCVYQQKANGYIRWRVPSRFMRKIVCRLRLNDVSRQ